MKEQRFWDRAKPDGDCLLWQGARIWNGYGKLGRDGVTWTAHRYAYFLTHGSIPDGMHICHHCDKKLCINPKHLFAGTRKDNMQDMLRKGRGRFLGLAKGSRSGAAKFVESDIAAMRRKFDAGATLKEIASEYKTTPAYASDLIRGKQWKHVTVQSKRFGRAKGNLNPRDARGRFHSER